jgi:hypothetical protein
MSIPLTFKRYLAKLNLSIQKWVMKMNGGIHRDIPFLTDIPYIPPKHIDIPAVYNQSLTLGYGNPLSGRLYAIVRNNMLNR